ncbi:MAG: phosphatidate cytidylyltransferase [Lachnospira sp.]
MRTRIISGAALGVIVVLFVALGGYYLFALDLIISLIGIFELLRVRKLEKTGLGAIAYIGAVGFYLSLLTDIDNLGIFTLIIAFLVFMSVYVFTFPKYKAEDIMWSFFSIFYVAVMLAHIYLLREMDNGLYMVWLIFVAAWGNDTFAYFTGVFLGKHKMAPILSPKKSVEGAIGGVAGATLLGVIYGLVIDGFVSDMAVNPIIITTIAAFFASLLAIIGDLAASAIKRNYDVKDYGRLIPGHGGILDRFDSVIFTAPAVYSAIMLITLILS